MRFLCRLFGHRWHETMWGFYEVCERCDVGRIALRWQQLAQESSD